MYYNIEKKIIIIKRIKTAELNCYIV